MSYNSEMVNHNHIEGWLSCHRKGVFTNGVSDFVLFAIQSGHGIIVGGIGVVKSGHLEIHLLFV